MAYTKFMNLLWLESPSKRFSNSSSQPWPMDPQSIQQSHGKTWQDLQFVVFCLFFGVTWLNMVQPEIPQSFAPHRDHPSCVGKFFMFRLIIFISQNRTTAFQDHMGWDATAADLKFRFKQYFWTLIWPDHISNGFNESKLPCGVPSYFFILGVNNKKRWKHRPTSWTGNKLWKGSLTQGIILQVGRLRWKLGSTGIASSTALISVRDGGPFEPLPTRPELTACWAGWKKKKRVRWKEDEDLENGKTWLYSVYCWDPK